MTKIDFPDKLENVKDIQSFAGAARATLDELGTDGKARDKAIADLADAHRKMTERAEAAAVRERDVVGTDRDLSRYKTANGGIALTRGTRRVEFGGVSFDAEDSPGLLDDAPVSEWQRDLQRNLLARHIARRALPRRGTGPAATPRMDAKILHLCSLAPSNIRGALEASIRARTGVPMDAKSRALSDTASSGGELVPDVFSTELYEGYYTPAGIAQAFASRDVSGPTVVATITDNFRPYIKNKITTDNPVNYTASNVTTSNATTEIPGLAVRTIIDDAVVEDAFLPLIPEFMRRCGRALTDGYEDAMINGDTAATHQDDLANWNTRSRWGAGSLGGSANHRRSFLGVRAICADRSDQTDINATQTIIGVMGSVVGALDERAASDIVLITSPEVMFKKLWIDPNVLTADKAGGALMATQFAGISPLMVIAGHPVVMSRWVTADLNASGLYDNATTTQSGILAVSRDEFIHMERRAALVEMDRDINSGGNTIVATMRRRFHTSSAAGDKVAWWGYNLL